MGLSLFVQVLPVELVLIVLIEYIVFVDAKINDVVIEVVNIFVTETEILVLAIQFNIIIYKSTNQMFLT